MYESYTEQVQFGNSLPHNAAHCLPFGGALHDSEEFNKLLQIYILNISQRLFFHENCLIENHKIHISVSQTNVFVQQLG